MSYRDVVKRAACQLFDHGAPCVGNSRIANHDKQHRSLAADMPNEPGCRGKPRAGSRIREDHGEARWQISARAPHQPPARLMTR